MVMVLAGACSDDDDAPADESATELVVEGFRFPSLSVERGTEIALVNRDPEPHTMTADDGSFDSGSFSADGGTLIAPGEPGIYPYHCNVHPTMTAELVVT